jgi:HK97 gp10 family phage protein
MRWPVATKTKLSGFKELDRALAELPKATGKNVLKRTLNEAADPIDAAASANAPFLTGGLERSVVVGTKLTRSQRGKAAKIANSFRVAAKNFVEVHVGTSLSKGLFAEFGTFKDRVQAWLRPAWDANKMQALDIIKDRLWQNIEKAATRYAKKLAKGR